MTRRKRLVTVALAPPLGPKVRDGLEIPPQVSGGKDFEEPAIAAILLIEEYEVGVLLFRLAVNGRLADETWHDTLEEAQEEAKLEFGDRLTNWVAVPPDEDNFLAFALRGIGENGDRGQS